MTVMCKYFYLVAQDICSDYSFPDVYVLRSVVSCFYVEVMNSLYMNMVWYLFVILCYGYMSLWDEDSDHEHTLGIYQYLTSL